MSNTVVYSFHSTTLCNFYSHIKCCSHPVISPLPRYPPHLTPLSLLRHFLPLLQDVSDRLCIHHPRLYIPGQQNLLFNKKTFVVGLFQGVFVSLVVFFSMYFVFQEGVDSSGKSADSLYFVGGAASGAIVFVVNLQVSAELVLENEMCVCQNEKRVPDKWQARQAIIARAMKRKEQNRKRPILSVE